MYRVNSVSRKGDGRKQAVDERAVDGSICSITILECQSQSTFSLEKCPNCISLQESSKHTGLPVTGNLKLRIQIGQAPDLVTFTKREEQTIFHFCRGFIESILVGCFVGEAIDVTVETSQSNETTNLARLKIYVDHIEHPPRCQTRRSTVEEETGRMDLIDNDTSDWNPDLGRFWLSRALALKSRGSWLVQEHARQQQQQQQSVWKAAFVCYSRALQLATLALYSEDKCRSGDSALDLEKEATKDSGFLDMEDLESPETASSGEEKELLGFRLLINLALCQLKAGSPAYAVSNCTEALKLVRAGEEEGASATSLGSAISSQQLAKAYHRRGQAYSSLYRWEEAMADLVESVRLQRLAGLSSEVGEALLARVRGHLEQDSAVMAKRLRQYREKLVC